MMSCKLSVSVLFSDLLEPPGVFHQLCHHLEELARDWLDGETWWQHRPTNEIVSLEWSGNISNLLLFARLLSAVYMYICS